MDAVGNTTTFTSGAVTAGARATVTWLDDRALVTVSGEVDATFTPSGASIREMLVSQPRPVDVDLSGVTLFCAAGVNWLISLYALDTQVRLVAPADCVREVLAACDVPLRSAGTTKDMHTG